MNITYGRISTSEQNEARQTTKGYKSFIDTCSGSISFFERPQAKNLIKFLKSNPDATTNIIAVDRLGRNTIDILQTVEYFKANNYNLKIENLGIDSNSPFFEMFVSIVGTLATQAKKTIAERCKQGIEIAKSKGAKRAILLPVSVPSHCSLMQKASEELKEYLTNITIKKPNIPVIHNVDVLEHNDANEIKDALSKQLCHPVRWVDTIEKIAFNKISDIAECGPGKVLTGLTKRISPELKGAALVNESAIDEFKALIQ